MRAPRKVQVLVACSLLAIALVGIVAWNLLLRPNVNGQRQRLWIKSLETASRPEDLPDLRSLGTGAVPTLLKALETKPNALDKVYSNAWSKLPASLKSNLPAPPRDVNVRINASVLLAMADPNTATNIPLSSIARALRDPVWQVRVNALNCLTLVILPKSGPEKIEILPMIEAATKDPEWQVRMVAANCLGFYKDSLSRVLPLLSNLLNDNYPDVRIRAAQAFYAVEPAAAEKAAAIVVAFDCLNSDGVHGSRYLATNFLRKIGKLH